MAHEELGKAFASHYYSSFSCNKQSLEALYVNDSIMTFEGKMCQGKAAIMEKIMGLTFKRIQHQVTSLDCQPMVDSGTLVVVMGQLKTDDDPPHSFSQTFLLRQANGTFFIANEVFRMILHD